MTDWKSEIRQRLSGLKLEPVLPQYHPVDVRPPGAIGAPVALAAGRLAASAISGLLFGLSATDAGTIAVAALALTGVAILAVYLPARRAMTVDPIVALRYE